MVHFRALRKPHRQNINAISVQGLPVRALVYGGMVFIVDVDEALTSPR